MNPVVNAQLKAFARSNPGSTLSTETLFEVFSIYSVANGILTDNIDPFSAHLEGTEFGLDGVAVMVQGDLCRTSDEVAGILEVGKSHNVDFNLFQAKTSEKCDYGDLSKFFDASSAFFSNNVIDPTTQLVDLMAAKDAVYAAALKRNPVLRLFYVTTGPATLSGHIKQLVETNKSRFLEMNIFDDVEISILGAKDLQAGYRSATNSIQAKIEVNKPITLPPHPAVQEAFLGFIAADQLVELATLPFGEQGQRRINRAVFFDNIRDFNPKSEINKGIIAELAEGKQTSFIFKNNGVTVVAKNINRKGDTFELEDYQIVNGCQTSNILFLSGCHATGVSVPFRLIGSSDPDFVASIIIGTNKQNEVKDDQFWALTPFMKDLEEYSREQSEERKIFIERRENQYRNETVERTRIVKTSELVKSMAAMFLFQPHRAARDYRGIRREYAGRIFQDSHSVVPYYTAAFAAYRADFAVRNKRVPSSWGIYKYYLLSAIGEMATKNKDIFPQKKAALESVCHTIVELFADEDQLVSRFVDTATILDKMISSNSITTREKVRDFIRTEATANLFRSEFQKLYWT